jgi:hypothetical protein
MSNNVDKPKKPRKAAATKTKKVAEPNDSCSFLQNLSNIKSIKIPDKFEEKEKLFHQLKIAISEIDAQIKNLTSRREYYMELIDVLDKDISTRKEKRTKDTSISIIQEELYSKYFIMFIAIYERKF